VKIWQCWRNEARSSFDREKQKEKEKEKEKAKKRGDELIETGKQNIALAADVVKHAVEVIPHHLGKML